MSITFSRVHWSHFRFDLMNFDRFIYVIDYSLPFTSSKKLNSSERSTASDLDG